MKDLFGDYETRSKLNVKDVGAWKYAAHPSTFPLMFAWKVDKKVDQWIRRRDGEEMPKTLRELAEDPSVLFHAHNANFEIAIWELICVELWGWASVPIHRWRDTAAKAAYANQPRALGNACKRVGTKERKDSWGTDLLNLLCGPQKCVKSKKYSKDTADGLHKRGEIRKDSISYLEEHGIEVFDHGFMSKAKSAVNGFLQCKAYWNDDPRLHAQLAKYNRQDVIAEQDLYAALPDLPDSEQKIWELDSVINRRGIPIDRDLCVAVQKVYKVETHICDTLISQVTAESDHTPKTVVERHTQGDRIKAWINRYVDFAMPAKIAETYKLEHIDKEGNVKSSLGKDIVKEFQKNPWGVERTKPQDLEKVLRVLELIQIAGGSGVKKFWAATDFIEDDDCARGQLLFYGASTGRWAGKGIQPHNMVREKIPHEMFFDVIKSGDHDLVKCMAELHGQTVNGLLRTCVRGLIRAPKGKRMIVSDFAGIEARVLQWVAGNDVVCELFADPTWDNYVHTAAGIFGLEYDSMMMPDPDHEGGLTCRPEYKDKRQVGKICVLALGYQMGAERYQGTCETFGVSIDLPFAKDIVTRWRESNPLIRALWKRVENAAKHVVKGKRNTTASVDGLLRFAWDRRGYLTIQLPSGRKLYYYRAKIDKETGGLVYLDGGNAHGSFYISTYGGKLVENIIQAISRDLLVYSAHLATADGLDLIFHVHDELVALADLQDSEAYGKLHNCMTSVPPWAKGLPLAAETDNHLRYTK